MKIKHLIHNYITSIVHIILSAIISIMVVVEVRYLRIVLLSSYRLVTNMSLGLLVLALISFILLYYDKEADMRQHVKASVPGLIYFIAYIVCRVILKG